LRTTERPSYRSHGTQTSDDKVAICQDERIDDLIHSGLAQDSLLEDGDGSFENETCGTEDEQTVRNEHYVAIPDESEYYYTAGPARFIVATDGVKECAALLMTPEMCLLAKKAINAEKEYTKAERMELDRRDQLMSLERRVKREIRAHEHRRRQLETSDASTPAEAIGSASDKELENLHLLLENIGQRIRTAASQLRTEAMTLRDCNQALIACLRDTFVVTGLVQPEEEESDTELEPLDIKEEFRKFCEQRREMEAGSQASSVAALNPTGETYLLVPKQILTAEEQTQQDLKNNFYTTLEQLENATREFDQRQTVRQQEQQTSDEDEQAFDLRWVQIISSLTRAVIDAEEAFAAARAAALEGGLNIRLDYQTSGFQDTGDDGYRISDENKLIQYAHTGRIDEWLSSVDHEQSSETDIAVDMDDWDVRSVEICDSGSAVAFGTQRTKIESWQRDCHKSE
jgi:hypothetical protein